MIKNLIDWKSIYNYPALFHIYFTSRRRGKSDTKGWEFLLAIIGGKESNFAWIRRRWHDSLLSTKPFFEDLVAKFCEEKKIARSHFEIKERGLFYQGAKRIDFIDLFSYQRKRGAVARTTYQEIVFEEAIPIDGEFLFVSGRTEQWMFHDLIGSLGGRTGKDKESSPFQTKITFLANPYLFSAWFLDVFQNLFNYKKEAEELAKKKDNSGVLVTTKDEQGVEWLLYLNLIEGEEDPRERALREKINPFLVNWDDFMLSIYTKTGNLKKYKIEHAIQDFFFCELGERKVNKVYFLMHFTKNKKEIDSDLVNFCFSLEEKAKSKLQECVIRPREKLINNWVNMLKEGELFFTDFRSRDWFLEQVKNV
ncbi:MAG: hypothetical protein I3273_06890 [Candidatus Moeniiplasma glomeromycotorum]|nr:hypothetical protein [Candidatus Moeniiplasma glomeromycotorum]MCE8168280.1 hypothetical protein [Candidatus Moeniiplasma glomeromycotorum]MCE8169812.1 hypothetical protein [Candidatus Moeniiplasma glomeromycotorum]